MAKLSETNLIENLLNEIIANYDKSDHDVINEAFKFATEGHQNQKRKSQHVSIIFVLHKFTEKLLEHSHKIVRITSHLACDDH